MSSKRARSPTPDSPSLSIDEDASINAFDNVLRQTYFLGSPDIADFVAWTRDNRGVWTAVEKEPRDGSDAPCKIEFFAVGKISTDQFYLTPEGGWSPAYGERYEREFCKTKARARIVKPDNELYASPWDKTVQNAEWLMKSHRAPDSRGVGNSLVVEDVDGGCYVPVRHDIFDSYPNSKLFESARAEQEDKYAYDSHSVAAHRSLRTAESCPDKRLLMENWECTSPDAQAVLHALIASNNDPRISKKYLGRAIPVHTADGELVLPSEYEQTLRGATVIVGFHILHQAFREPDLAESKALRRRKIQVKQKDEPRVLKDHYFADITGITVLGAPPPEPVSEAKERGFELPPYLKEGASQPRKKTRRW